MFCATTASSSHTLATQADRRDRWARPRGRQAARARDARRGARAPRAHARADQARHRGRNAPRDRPDPQGGRDPDDPCHREGHAQDAERRRPAQARRDDALGDRSTSACSRARKNWPAMQEILQASTRARCSRPPAMPGSSTSCATSSASFADALAAHDEMQVFFFFAVLLDGGEAGRAHAHPEGRRPADLELPGAAHRGPPHAGPAARTRVSFTTSSGIARDAADPGRGDKRDRAQQEHRR